MKYARAFLIALALGLFSLCMACGTPQSSQPNPTAAPLSTSAPSPTAIPGPPTATPMPTVTPTPPPPTPTPVEGPGYGGYYIAPEDDSVVYIFLVNPSQEAAEKVAQTHISSLVYKGIRKVREVRPVQANYTFRQLQRWYDHLLGSGIWDIPELTMSDVSERINRIEYGIDCERDRDRVERQIREILTRENVPQNAVKVSVEARAMSPLFECAPPEVFDPATGLSSPGFGGLFFDHDTRTITVYMLNPSQRKAEELAFEVAGRETLELYPNVRALQGQYTWEQLQGWHDEINNGSQDLIAHHLPGGAWLSVYPDEFENRLRVENDSEGNPEAEAEVWDFLERFGVPREAVILE